MYIAKNNDLIILASQTREELERQLQFMVYTSIEETDVEYELYNGEYCPKKSEEKKLTEAKETKSEENTTKAKEAIENGYVFYKEAQFETNAQTVGDLTATTLLMQASRIETYDWLSKDDKIVTMTLEDFATLGGIIAGYKNSVWNNKYIKYKEDIEACETKEEVEAIVIDYTTNDELLIEENSEGDASDNSSENAPSSNTEVIDEN